MTLEERHHHLCPYCEDVWSCDDNCYSARLTNKICPRCLEIDDKETSDIIKQHSTEWTSDVIW